MTGSFVGRTFGSRSTFGFRPPLVGIETSDDAAVHRLTDEIAMIKTIDFINPPVDDPYWFGQISAANSISDVYSMGGRPLTALNVVMFPSKNLDIGVLKGILHGGHDKVVEAGARLVGGHTADDEEPKYGLCVNGVVHPDRIVTNAGSRPGDALILTKPLGTGVLFNAVRSGKMPYRDLERDVLPSVARPLSGKRSFRKSYGAQGWPHKGAEMAKKKIVFIDDDPEYIEGTKEYLAKKHDVATALSAEEGLEEIKKQVPDLIILDTMMEPKSGFDLARELKADLTYRDVPFLMLTAVATQVQTTKYSQADILTFPGEEYVDMAQGVKDVLAAIERLIGS